jgi:YfiH family protein
MMEGIVQYMLPELSPGFKWIQSDRGPALVCEALEPFARHLFTTRAWTLGTSAGADHIPGWDELARAIGVRSENLLRAKQVHGSTVVVHRHGDGRTDGRLPEADILTTDDQSMAVAVQTADCVPLLIADRRTGSVAAAHAGWRGLAAQVPRVAVEALRREFGSRPGDLVAAIGPAISGSRYEVGSDVRSRFEHAGCTTDQLARWFSDAARSGHWYFDGSRAAFDQLVAAGLAAAAIHQASLCTAGHPDIFCSYRRDGRGAGRIAGAIRPHA